MIFLPIRIILNRRLALTSPGLRVGDEVAVFRRCLRFVQICESQHCSCSCVDLIHLSLRMAVEHYVHVGERASPRCVANFWWKPLGHNGLWRGEWDEFT